MASPQITGMCAMFLSLNPWATPAQVKKWLLGQATNAIYSTGLDNDYNNAISLCGGNALFAYMPFNNPNPVNIVGQFNFINPQLKFA